MQLGDRGVQNDKALREWCKAASTVVSPAEAKDVPPFALAYRAYQIWCGLPGVPIPARQHLDPIIMGPELLPNLSIIEVITPQSDYRWALVGERIPWIIGTRLKGNLLSQIEEQVGEIVMFRELLDRVTREHKPLFYILRHRTTDGRLKRSYGVLLPLCDLNDGDASRVVVASILSASDATTGA